jgi:uncharacterized protein YbjT (DUF2867 family)
MVVLVAGATGFIGGALARELCARGHEIIGTTRNPAVAGQHAAVARWVPADYTRDHTPSDWLVRLVGVDVAVNAVGIYRESGDRTFESVHIRAPRALFAACVQAGVRVVQISALGADSSADTAFHLSKRAADEYLLGVDPRAAIVQPSLVYGPGGASAAAFNLLASLPLIPLPQAGSQRIQPVHIDDLACAIATLVERDDEGAGRIPVVGPEPITLREYLAALRESLRLGRARFAPIPWPVLAVIARICAFLPGSVLTPDSLRMLSRGNTADPAATCHLLRRPPRPASAFIAAAESEPARLKATAAWSLALLRLSIAVVWIASGVVSLGLYPVEESYRLLERVGITGLLAPITLYGSALLDIAFGVGSLVALRWRYLWAAQAAVIIAYTGLITVALPEFWLHPFGPIVKNLPMLAALAILHGAERR